MKIIKDNEELKLYIKDGVINIQEDLQCDFNVDVAASISCWNLTCWDLTCWNLNCRDLTCWGLSCGDLNYYAFAVAYNSFKCKSAKGRRDNSIHLCLDSEIEYIKEPAKQEMTIAEIEKALGKSIKIVKE